MQDLGTLPPDDVGSVAYDVSADGSVVVGLAWPSVGEGRAFRWTAAGGMENLGTLGGGLFSEAWGVSADGSVVVGWARNADGDPRAFRWENGVMQDLGTLPGGDGSVAYDVSADGSVVVGGAANAAGQSRASRWTQATGMEDLNQTYASLLTDGSVLELAYAISPDGRYIVGRGYNAATGRTEAFLLDTARPPIVLVPGIAGTYAADASADIGWLLNRGQPPANTVVDPLGRVYHDLIQTLRNVGYRDGIDLFVVNYDWRLPPGPSDGQFDGHIGGLEAQALADEQFRYAVDYVGWALRQAAESWRSRTGRPLEKVHAIAHSTGGLVTRTYIQSDAYGGIYDQANGYRLPEIDQFILVGVPNRGASKAWNPLHDNWIADPVYRVVLSKIVNRGYQKVLSGHTIAGPDHAIDRSSISPTGQPDPQLFISQYVPTIRSLLATYDFIDFGQGFTTVNQDPHWRNELILDLNDGLDLTPTADPSPFADRVRATVICGASERTANLVVERTGTAAPNVLLPFTDFLANDAETTDVWFEDLWLVEGGDGTVPLESCQEPFVGDERVNLLLFRKGENTSGAADHTGLMSNPDVQAAILDALGVTYDRETDIASGTGAQIGNALAVISDPVELFLVDGAGRRLGYSQATGAVTEIPGSLWRGDTEGIGYVFGTLEEPLRLELTGLGEDHYVMVSLERDGHPAGGAISSGFLAQGEEKTISVERLQGFNLFLPVVAR